MRARRVPPAEGAVPRDRVSGDCCTPALPWGDLPVADFLARCLVARLDGFEIRYLDRTDLIRMRRAVGRAKDLRRADELERLATR